MVLIATSMFAKMTLPLHQSSSLKLDVNEMRRRLPFKAFFCIFRKRKTLLANDDNYDKVVFFVNNPRTFLKKHIRMKMNFQATYNNTVLEDLKVARSNHYCSRWQCLFACIFKRYQHGTDTLFFLSTQTSRSSSGAECHSNIHCSRRLSRNKSLFSALVDTKRKYGCCTTIIYTKQCIR